MRRRIFRTSFYIYLVISLMGITASAVAAEKAVGPTTTLDQASQIATNPTAYNASFQLQPTYMELEPSGQFYQLLLRLVLPARGFFIPNLKVSDFFTIYRFEAPEGNIKTPTGSGFGLNDYTFTALAVKPGVTAWAFGSEIIFPTATSDLLGQGKYQVGPTFILASQKYKKVLLGVFAQNFFSVGGQEDRPHLNYLNLQPIITFYLPKAIFIIPNVQYIVDWTHQGGTQVQPSLGIGRSFTKNFVVTFTPNYIVSGPNQHAWTYQLNLKYQGF